MKKFLSMAALAVAALSCTEDLEAPQVETPTTGETKTITVEASLSADDQTRVAIDGDGSGYEWDFKWEASDELHYTTNGYTINSLSIAKDNDGNFNEKRAEFSGEVPTSGEEYLYYGYTNTQLYDGLTITLSSQDGSISQIPLKSQDKIDFSSIEDGASIPVNMNHMGAFININAQFNGMSGYKINKVVVMGLNSDYIYGLDMYSTDEEIIELYKKSNITITPDSPIAVGGEQITIPFTTFPTEVTEAEPITVVFCLTDGSGAEKFLKIVKTPSAGNTFNLKRATVNNLGAELSSSELFAFNGKGTTDNPYKIEDADDLNWLSLLSNLSFWKNNQGNVLPIHCIQTADIDLDNQPFTPIDPFAGSYKGEKHTISGLNIKSDSRESYGGLFGQIINCTVSDLAVQGTINYTNYCSSVGGIVGYIISSSTITNCYSDIEINVSGIGADTGGIVSSVNFNSTVENCYNNGKISSKSTNGAIAGRVSYLSNVIGCKYLAGSAPEAIGYVSTSKPGTVSGNTAVETEISIEEFFGLEPAIEYTVAEIKAGKPITDGNASDCTWIITDKVIKYENENLGITTENKYNNISIYSEATSLGDNAFSKCGALTSIVLPKATSVGNSAFSKCGALTSVELPEATSLGDNAFFYCTALPSIVLPKATSVGNSAFSMCTALTSVELPKATTVGNNVFLYCAALASVALPQATTLGDSVFSNCAALASVVLPQATTLGDFVFEYCAALASVELPNATSVGNFAFSTCTALTSVKLPKATTVGNYAFYYCTALASVVLPQATTFGNSAFSSCGTLTSVELPNATTLGDSGFSNCKTLTSVDLPKATTLGNNVFYNCNALASVVLPNATTLGNNDFSNCGILTTLKLTATTAIDHKNSEAFYSFTTTNCDLYLSNANYEDVTNGNVWAGKTWKSISKE